MHGFREFPNKFDVWKLAACRVCTRSTDCRYVVQAKRRCKRASACESVCLCAHVCMYARVWLASTMSIIMH